MKQTFLYKNTVFHSSTAPAQHPKQQAQQHRRIIKIAGENKITPTIRSARDALSVGPRALHASVGEPDRIPPRQIDPVTNNASPVRHSIVEMMFPQRRRLVVVSIFKTFAENVTFVLMVTLASVCWGGGANFFYFFPQADCETMPCVPTLWYQYLSNMGVL